MTIVGTLRIPVPPQRRAAVLEILRAVQGPVVAEPGCLACHVCEEDGPEPSAILLERWDSEQALEAHLRSEAYRQILGAIELASHPPEVRFDRVSSSEGIELIERTRAPKASIA